MLYRVAAGTGFRVSELRSLTPASFRLDDDPPAIALHAASSKHRRDDVQPIRPDLAELLRGWLDDRTADAPLWPGKWQKDGARMIRGDLRQAKARWIKTAHDRQERRKRRDAEFLAVADDAGRVVDFHSLRVSFVTLLVKAGASVKAVQELARHSTPTLTLGVYTKLGIHDLTGALDGLPNLTPAASGQERLRATGSLNDRPVAPIDSRLFPRQLERRAQRRRCAQAVN
jgi:integrase